MLIKIFVNDKSYDTEDGYTLIADSPYQTGIIVETALKNGFKDIRISEPDAEEKLQYNKINQLEIGGITL